MDLVPFIIIITDKTVSYIVRQYRHKPKIIIRIAGCLHFYHRKTFIVELLRMEMSYYAVCITLEIFT